MSFPGMPGRGLAAEGEMAGMSAQEQNMVKHVRKKDRGRIILAANVTADCSQMQAAMESCPAKTVIAGGMGFALGGAFGLFMSSVSLPGPYLPIYYH